LLFNQFGMTLMLALWGWYKIAHRRWKIFFVTVIVFDCVYTVFLNIISFEITAFAIPTSIVLAVLMGNGIADILTRVRHASFCGKTTYGVVRFACAMMPVIPLVSGFDLCNQSRNYMAYEHVLNIFRTVNDRGILFLDGDNNIFPVTYGRIVEWMREDVTLYDRLNLLFRMPPVAEAHDNVHSRPGRPGLSAEGRFIENAKNDVYFAVFNPDNVSLPHPFTMYPFGILYRPLRSETPCPECLDRNPWPLYETESVLDDFHKDFMNRHLSAHFHFALGKYLFASNQPALGLKAVEWASQIAYDDTMIHSDIGLFLIDKGFLDEARTELEKALIHAEDLSGIYTNWGYYYWKRLDYDRAIEAFQKAVELCPGSFDFYNNLGIALHRAGRIDDAVVAFQHSLKINPDQPKVMKFLGEHGLSSFSE
jgi:tetratricopeptide (TPR) repeat protein